MPNFERIPHGGQRVKTSHSDPLWFAVVTPGPKFGRIGITLCPGKHDADGGKYDGGTYWKRDLATDLDAIRDWGARADDIVKGRTARGRSEGSGHAVVPSSNRRRVDSRRTIRAAVGRRVDDDEPIGTVALIGMPEGKPRGLVQQLLKMLQ
jgi:hypothetical protein